LSHGGDAAEIESKAVTASPLEVTDDCSKLLDLGGAKAALESNLDFAVVLVY
jgi:hypothetical protein